MSCVTAGHHSCAVSGGPIHSDKRMRSGSMTASLSASDLYRRLSRYAAPWAVSLVSG